MIRSIKYVFPKGAVSGDFRPGFLSADVPE